jgi:UDP-glucose 4-epimerase
MINGTPRVAISAASSFTGAWLCRIFDLEGWEVDGLCTLNGPGEYKDLRATRVQWASQHSRLHLRVKSDDGSMRHWIEKNPATIWIHHHHHMQDFRSLQYDTSRAAQVGREPLEGICQALKDSGYRGIIFSGSYFEPGEGDKSPPGLETPYAKSKKEVWHDLEEMCDKHGLLLSKVVIPDPVGPLENDDRLIPALVRAAQADLEFPLKNPLAVADRISVDALAQVYVEAANKMINDETWIARPSGWVGSNWDWIDTVNRLLIQRGLGLTGLNFDDKPGSPSPSQVASCHNPPEDRRDINWEDFFVNYARWIKTGEPWKD